ncbi:MAG: phosphoribosylanthranilate isomerase [Methanomassiliicoccales archaeon]|jgi:phosphoribosylanthranilate isomerase
MTKVKICGMMRDEDIISSRKADYVGFIVETSSKRELTISRAEELMSMAKCKKVIVTTCQSEEVLKQIVRVLKPDVLQLHSVMEVEDVEVIANAVPCDVWALQPIGWGDELQRAKKLIGKCSGLVLDTASASFGGAGMKHDWTLSAEIVEAVDPFPVVLAGGLNPGNIVDAIIAVHPFAVDVSTGVETGGRKAMDLVDQFISNARSVH